MHPTHEAQVIFGIDPTLYAGVLFVLTYVLIITERMNRAIISLSAACLMILGGVLTQEAAFEGVDFNTLGLLTGMMVIVGITRNSGVFQYLAIWSAKKVNADPWGILVMLVVVTAVLSALLDNVTTVLLIAPVTLLITDALKISAYPYLFAEIFASNIGGTATLIGDPPNIMIGSAVGLSFNDFLFNLAPITLIILPLTMIPIYLIAASGLRTQVSGKGHGLPGAGRHHRYTFAEAVAVRDRAGAGRFYPRTPVPAATSHCRHVRGRVVISPQQLPAQFKGTVKNGPQDLL